VWLLSLRLSPEWRDFVLGDLEEEFIARRHSSPPAAVRWFWWQTIRCVCAPPVPRTPAAEAGKQGDSILRTLLSDFRYAIRVLWRAPAFTLAVIAVLALGIGANTAIFSIVNAVLLRPLPFAEPDRIVRLFHVPPQDTFPGMPTFSVSPANFYDWKRDAGSFDAMAIYRFRQFALTGSGEARAVIAAAVGADFFEVVRAQPALGRVFLREEDTPGRSHVVILSDGFWKAQFGGSRDVVGKTLTLDREPYTIVGVMPPQFSIVSWAATAREIWVPLAYSDTARAVRENHNAQVIARLKSGVDLAQARSEMNVISARLEREFPRENAGWGATVIPLQEVIVGDMRMPLLMLLGAVALVLLIACANVGNLLFARALTRRKELAIRAALGAGRVRVFQQLLVEALVLAFAGGAIGLAVAHLSLRTASTLLTNQVPRADEISLDGRVLLFAAAAAIVTGILAGALPALRAGRTDVNESLKEGGRQDAGVGVRTRRLLIVCEVALSLVLLMGAAVMLRSLASLRGVDAGFDPRGVLTMNVALPESRYSSPEQTIAFFGRALERIRALPGVAAAGAIDDLPLLGGSVQPIVVEGRPELLPRDQPTVEVRKITPGYLSAMRIVLLQGRDVTTQDKEVLLVSRAAAKLLWGDENPIGQRISLPLESRTVLKEVIGIVGDVKQGQLADTAAPTVYEFTRQHASPSMTLVLRTSVPPLSVAQSASAVVRTMDPEQPVEDIRSMETVIEETLTSQRFSALLLGVFAAVALTLATVGIYSVLSYIVRGRNREIGIRTALGAQTADVLRLVVLEGMTPALIGICAGAAAALGTARILQQLVYGISASDPLTLAAVAGALGLVALLASLVPAYRASKVDPLSVLRST
jgi:predicted permease